ncbi:hypothetical protein SK3146_03087 [Paenibacillus konkukensis]|uniref:Glycosyltransferase RgtA/B/C/D-like domain-containing protein n=1 Tax=Paenibacillus konkukensis TaxID=2020716 RepID=A0ABY4RNX6_9BACL|nr:hypothetical protein [Paenibacillus konkukensis]UQZ83880.1 hypothetical protein SK3146_03087 [Paenibacillus konkukensis]
MKALQKGISWFMFFLVFAVEFALGYYMAICLGFIHSDALSRVANAFFVLYSRQPHLGAIGFIWNPLPSFLEVIVLTLYPIFKTLATHGLAGVIVSSFFAGLSAKLIYDAGTHFKLSTFLKIVLVLLYCFNPFILLFGADGMSDIPFIYFIMYATVHFTIWLREYGPGSLIKCAFALALAFWVRYEAAMVGGAIAVCILLIMWNKRSNDQLTFKERYFKTEASSIIALTPLAFSGILWVFFNYIIMGNPLYFLNSEYSNTAQSQTLAETSAQIQNVRSSLFTIMYYIGKKMAWFSAPYLTLIIIHLINGKLFSKDTIRATALFLCIPSLQVLLLFKGSSMVFFRYFMYIFPLMVALMPYTLFRAAWKKLSALLCIASLIVTGVMLSYALSKPNLAGDEYNVLLGFQRQGYYYQRQVDDRAISAWIDEHLPNNSIITDSSSSYGFILSSSNPKKYIINSDNALFNAFLDNPSPDTAEYALVPNNLLSNNLPSKLNDKYFKLYNEGMPWAELYHDFNNEWRLYKIIKPQNVESSQQKNFHDQQ